MLQSQPIQDAHPLASLCKYPQRQAIAEETKNTQSNTKHTGRKEHKTDLQVSIVILIPSNHSNHCRFILSLDSIDDSVIIHCFDDVSFF